ncbi:MAG: hypothetical protein LAT78_06325 [Roseinatronobacter sp.]|nr:hypothetical protein [Roseinatronobacter sp.]
MKLTMIKLLGTAALASFGFSASAQTVINIGIDEVIGSVENNVSSSGTLSPATGIFTVPSEIDISVTFGSLPVDPNQALATANSAVTQIQNASVQINSIATNVAEIDGSINLEVGGENGLTTASNAANEASEAGNTAGNIAFDFAVAIDNSTTVESIEVGQVIEETTTDTLAANGAFAAATSSATASSSAASEAASSALEGSVFVFGDISALGLGVTNTTDVAYLSNLAGTVSSAANTSNTAASFDSFNADGLGVNALATNTASINGSITGSFTGGSATVGSLSTVAAGAINTARISGATQIIVE